VKKKNQIKLETLVSEQKLEELRSHYEGLSKILPRDIKILEERMAARQAEFDKLQQADLRNLTMLKMAMKNLPQFLDQDSDNKTPSENAQEMVHIGQKIREVRQSKNWSQRTLGVKIKKSQAEVSRYEREGKIPDNVLTSMSKALEINKKELVRSLPN
jgi:ribosome-binding protein aMBF1 (putative translation factor)